MRVDLFDFTLPPERIALRPAEPRDSARLLVIDPQRSPALADHVIGDLPSFLKPGDVVVVNDTRVIPARLDGVRSRDGLTAKIEITLHKMEGPERWRAFAKPGKRLKAGDRLRFGAEGDSMACMLAALDAIVVEKSDDGDVLLQFDLSGPALLEAIERLGHMPLPPYIASKRGEDSSDVHDYQTMFASDPGSVAAPTAGLHFTPDLAAALTTAGVSLCRVTLHVGAGTFLPVKVDDTAQHRMHSEYGEVSADVADTINAVHARGGRVVAVGTTSLRLLESATGDNGIVRPFGADTAIFITPGYRFKCVDLLLTNFHLPRSTLFMLVSAFSGLEVMKNAYAHAIATGYRFYSYGDACLLHKSSSGSHNNLQSSSQQLSQQGAQA